MKGNLTAAGPFLPGLPITAPPSCRYSQEVLPKGHQKAQNFKSLECDIFYERNVRIPMRDGAQLYADVFRPNNTSELVPAIIAWSPYGKHLNSHGMLKDLPERLGTSQANESGYENFEGPDPGFWVPRGYAVVNVDVRGSWHSEGDFYYWGRQTQRDGYDTVEHLAELPWCNRKVAMAGNSWLAISQWFIAAGSPPHLAAIAPWEGFTDTYRDQHRRGGVSNHVMPTSLALLVPGDGVFEDAGAMARRHPCWDEYWTEKRADLSKITVPTYVVASYSSKIHCAGTFRGYRQITSKEKWLRVHPHQEWYDFVNQQTDLARFFDHFLRNIQNDWTSTPRVRLSLLRFNGSPIIDRPLTTYPPECDSRRVFLDACGHRLLPSNPKRSSSIGYSSNGKEEIHFDLTFDKYTELIGYCSVTLYVQCLEHNDMDIFVMLRKLGRSGQAVRHVNFPTAQTADQLPRTNVVQYNGPTGRLRVSHRDMKDCPGLAPGEVFHPHTREVKLSAREIVAVTIGLWPIGSVYAAGEGVRLSISGKDMCFPEMEHFPAEPNENRGVHIVHTGGEYASYLTLPVVKGC
ncbi:Alpha/Beta hydrolase protein [Aspergillus pseudoustus]|uniref:Alpha/Beta hydrolase protein n=1 Tax=Aspergillus pseudoustus TaxID=1810923 RepID=A0ABR4IWS0_9EURO